MSVYVLHDSRYDSYLSRGDTFNRQWMAYIQNTIITKFVPVSMSDFAVNDTVIIYMDNSKPYGNYNLPRDIRKIFIVGELRKDNIEYLKDASHIIYLSPLQHKVAVDYGISCENTVCPHHPFPVTNTIVPKRDMVFFGGIFNTNKSSAFETRVLDLHKSIPTDFEFMMYLGGQGSQYKVKTSELHKWLSESEINGNRLVTLEFGKYFYRLFNLNIIAAKKVFLWRNELTASGNHSIDAMLDNGIRESSILPIAKHYGCDVECEDRLSYISNFNGTEFTFDFIEFSELMKKILK